MASTELLLALDAGTGSGRAVVFDAEGRTVAHARRRWVATRPPELAPFGREYDPEALWSSLLEAAREALARVDRARVRAVAATGQRIACAFLDAAGDTLYLGPNGDIRALGGADLDDLDADALYTRTGRFPPWIAAPARLRWFRDAAPETFARIRHVLGVPDWIAFRLSGERATDPTTAADLMMLDVASRERVTDAGLDDALWPPVAAPGDRLGPLRGEVAEALGLPAGVAVAVGGADTQLALLGCDVSEAGTALVAGSSAPLVRVTEVPVRDPEGRLWTDPHVRPDRWLLEANLGEMGTLHAWTLETLGADLLGGEEPYAAYDALAAEAPLGCRGASAHLGPRAMDLRDLNTGRPAGLLMPFGETTASEPPRRAELLRAYLESCAYAARAGREWLDAVSDDDGRLTVAGGLSRSRFFCRILASVLRREVIGDHPEASARGAAMCAAAALDWASDPSGARERLGRAGAAFEPDEDDADAYDDAYERWVEREEQLERF